MEYPFEEINSGDNVFIRTFNSSVNELELYWHKDKEDRIISPLIDTNWKLQMDNEIPKVIEGDMFIPKNTYHRVIKGDDNLKIKLIKK
jgi:uncharacterized protein YxjI